MPRSAQGKRDGELVPLPGTAALFSAGHVEASALPCGTGCQAHTARLTGTAARPWWFSFR